jgi:hypothetical protein
MLISPKAAIAATAANIRFISRPLLAGERITG